MLTPKANPGEEADNAASVDSRVLSDLAWREVGQSLKLSARELEVVRHVFADLKEASIAEALGISRHTVRTYTERLYRKLGVRGRVALVVRVLDEFLRLTASSGSALPPICPHHTTRRCPLSD
jgi:DNA-binding CsgD family transcriptional regulator